MSEYIILDLCLIIIIAYFFDLSFRFIKIPGAVLLILLGMVIQLISDSIGVRIPNLRPVLPVLGTLGLIMIVMEASLDIELKWEKRKLIFQSVSSAFFLFFASVAIFSLILVQFYDVSFHDSLLNAIPLSIISSSIAIPSSAGLKHTEKEFIVYESSFSDIIGIMVFDFVLFNKSTIGSGILIFVRDTLVTVIIALISTGVLGYLLYKNKYHVNHIIILTFIVLAYSLAKIIHLPALLLILIFGLVLANNRLLENDFLTRFIDFTKFKNDIISFKKILVELTFLVRSFFFVMFGFYTQVFNLLSLKVLIAGLIIILILFLLRGIFLKTVLRIPFIPLLFFAPRGLITILLFLSIPYESRIWIISEEVVTALILLSIIIMAIGNILRSKENHILPEKV